MQLAPFYSNRLRRSCTNLARINFTAGRVRDFRCPPEAKQIFIRVPRVLGCALPLVACLMSFKVASRATRFAPQSATLAHGISTALARKRANFRNSSARVKDPRVEKAAAIAVTQAWRVESRRRQATLDAVWKSYIDVNRSRWSDHHVADHEKVSHRGGEMRRRSVLRGECPCSPRHLKGIPKVSRESPIYRPIVPSIVPKSRLVHRFPESQ